jgi:hypothetical protein
MFGSNRRLRALVYLFVLFPLWWLQRTHANPLSGHSAGGHAHGHHAKSVQPGGDGGHHSNSGGGGDGDDGGGHDGDDGGGGGGDGDDGGGDGDDGGHDGDDDDGHDGDDDDDGGGITDCNHNGIDDSIDIANGTSQDVNQDGIPDECQSFTRDYCNGTGAANGGVDCPCGNTVRSGTPTGCANSTGTGATLTASGSPFVSHDTLVLTVTNIPLDHTGVFYMGSVRNPGVTYGDGTRCIAAPLVRVSKVSHSTGRESIPVPGSPPLSEQLNITAGQTTGFQVFYRDASGPCHTGFNASNAILIHWGP